MSEQDIHNLSREQEERVHPRSSFSRIKGSEIFLFLLFFLLSCLFWFAWNFQKQTEQTLKVPVRYQYSENEISISGDLIHTIHVTVSDKGNHLLGYMIHPENLTLDLDLMPYRTAGGIARIPMSKLENSLLSKLKSGAEIRRIEPDSILVYFVEKASKAVPVRLQADLKPAQQYMLNHTPTVKPGTVRVHAPAAVLETLEYVDTELLEISELTDTIRVKSRLKSIDGASYSTEEVEVFIPVEAYTESSFQVPVTAQNLPEGFHLRCFPSTATVRFLVGQSQYPLLKLEDFELSVDYLKFLESEDQALQELHLTRFPEGIGHIQIQPESVECLLEKL